MNVSKSDERALPTLENDGRRRWLKPTLSPGPFLNNRRLVAYVLIAAFVVLPILRLNGRPLFLLDVAHREFTLFGKVFLPTDTLLLVFVMLTIFVGVFLMTALLGRIWCGWACPQTVYMETVFRPLERFFERKGRGKKLQWRLAKYTAYLAVCLALAHVFLAWFVPWESLVTWVTSSPFKHPQSFLLVMAVTFLMMFDFCFFREQLCLVACPYGRFQSALLDRHSLIVAYDTERGEPRGKKRKGADAATLGDCVDCGLCVRTCPTGIDIRQGLQLECIGCAQCIDACDAIMEKLDRPVGLVRYSSQAALEKERFSLFRPRVLIYPALILVFITAFTVLLLNKQSTDVTILRQLGNPVVRMDDGRISNGVRVKLTNRAREAASYSFSLDEQPGLTILQDLDPIFLEAGESITIGMTLASDASLFTGGKRDIELHVRDERAFAGTFSYRMLGPVQ